MQYIITEAGTVVIGTGYYFLMFVRLIERNSTITGVGHVRQAHKEDKLIIEQAIEDGTAITLTS